MVEVFFWGQFEDLSQIHDGDTVTDELYHVKVVGDEEIGEPKFFLEIQEEI